MFREEKRINNLAKFNGTMIYLSVSVNTPEISISRYPCEQSKSYVVFMERGDVFFPFLYFYLVKLNQGFLYSYDRMPIERNRMEALIDEANEYVSNMGFMMEEIDLKSLRTEEISKIKKDLPFLYENLDNYAKVHPEKTDEEESDEEEVQIIEVKLPEAQEKDTERPERKLNIKSIIEKYKKGVEKDSEEEDVEFSLPVIEEKEEVEKDEVQLEVDEESIPSVAETRITDELVEPEIIEEAEASIEKEEVAHSNESLKKIGNLLIMF